MLRPQDFFDVQGYDHKDIFAEDKDVWTALDRLQEYLAGFFQKSWPLSTVSGQVERPLVIYNGEVRDDLEVQTASGKNPVQVYLKGALLKDAAVILPGAHLFDDRIIIGPGSVVEPGALIKGPVIIGKNTEVRQGAYVRGDCLIGDECVVGHTTEIKSSIMLDGAKAGHFAYIGDSILGKGVNLGAGTKLANLKIIPESIVVTAGKTRYKTGRRKLGAILGDYTETGCNSVTSPGTLLGPRSLVYPAVSVPARYYPGRTIIMHSESSLIIRSPEL